MKKNKKINIVGLSQKLGLSVSSVSRALNGYDNISQKTKDKIFKTAKKYNYFPDLNAKRLASKKTDTIAFISSIDPDAPDHVVLQFLAGITLGIKNTNTELITKFCLNEDEEMNYFKKLISTGQADKFIFYKIKKNDERVHFLNQRGIKFVTWGRTNKQTEHAWIDLDNKKSIELLMDKLSNNGHKRIAFINVHRSFNYGAQRKAANEIGLSIFNNDAGFTSNTGDITGVTAGTGLSGGGTSGGVTINVDYAGADNIILVSNAGTNPAFGPLEKLNDNAFDKVLDVNLKSSIWLVNEASPYLKKNKASSIIIMSSISALIGTKDIGAYGISKAAEVSLVKNLAVELGPYGIRVNAIAPGLIKTEFSRALWSDKDKLKKQNENTPLQRIGYPEDISGIVHFLARDASSFITGQLIVADGGETITSTLT